MEAPLCYQLILRCVECFVGPIHTSVNVYRSTGLFEVCGIFVLTLVCSRYAVCLEHALQVMFAVTMVCFRCADCLVHRSFITKIFVLARVCLRCVVCLVHRSYTAIYICPNTSLFEV